MNRKKYMGDTRYAKVLEKMDLLGIMDITTTRQHKNGTITWKLPIKNQWDNGSSIEVGSFASGYVRNNNSCSTNYQLNKRRQSEPQYYKDCEWNSDFTKQTFSGKYNMYTTRECVLIPNEIDRLEYLIGFCLKNYYIRRANFIPNGDYIHIGSHNWEIEKAKNKNADQQFEMNALQNKLANSVPKWKYDEAMDLGKAQDCGHYDRINELEDSLESSDYRIKDLERMLDGHKGRETNHDQELEKAHNRVKDLEKIVNTLKDSNLGYKSREKDLENKLEKAYKNEFYPYSMEIRVNGQKYKVDCDE